MNKIFVDTSYFIAIIDRKDNNHKSAIEIGKKYKSSSYVLVTTQMVLTELLNFFAEKGELLRSKASRITHEIQASSNVVVHPQTSFFI